jgi:hypothetical protein
MRQRDATPNERAPNYMPAYRPAAFLGEASVWLTSALTVSDIAQVTDLRRDP